MSFTSDIKAFVVQEVDEEVQNLTMLKAKRVFQGAYRRTPVYRGRLRAAWFASTNAPVYKSVLHGGSPERPLHVPKWPRMGRVKPYTKVFITNGQPYSQIVNDGIGTLKSPKGMVELSIRGATGDS